LKDTGLEWREHRTVVISYSEGRVLSLKENSIIKIKGKIEQITVVGHNRGT